MKVAVLIAGVADPKWPITPAGALGEDAGGEHRIMSPFDEAALEMALRLRDADPATRIVVQVGGGAAGQRIARAVAAFNISEVGTLALARPWDQGGITLALAQLCDDADLVLIGREYGDFDDGLVPPMLAGLLGLPFFGRAQTVEAKDGTRFMRETGFHSETLTHSGRLVVSVTNDRRTRLRKLLMKNVMQARQAVIAERNAPTATDTGLALERLTQRTAGRAATDCTLLTGTLDDQAMALADLLWDART